MVLDSRVAAVCALALLASASPASGDWTKVTGIGEPDSSTLEVGIARNGGTSELPTQLNVLWTRDKTVYNTRVRAIKGEKITGPANVLDPQVVFTYNHPSGGVMNRVQLLRTADGGASGGLRAFFAGLYPDDPHDVGLSTATSIDGASWNVQPTLASDSRTGTRSSVYAAAGIGGTIANNGTPISIWGDSAPGEAGYHVGLSDQTADARFSSPTSATVGGPNAATDAATGQVAIAWSDLDADRVLVQSIFPAGPRLNTPGGRTTDALERVALTGRFAGSQPRPGIYVAYLRGTNGFLSRPAVWRIGADNPMVLSSKRGARFVGVTAAQQGRLWAFWGRRPGTAWRIYARRSNQEATRFGATVVLKPPGGTDSLFSLEGDGFRGHYLDLLALVQRSGNDLGNWYQAVAPGITLLAKVLDNGKVRFTTLDAGDPLNTTITFDGRSEETGNDGEVVMSADPGKHVARATNPVYATAKRRVKVPAQD